MKTNIHTKFLQKKSDEQLLQLVNNLSQADDVRLAALWLLQERNITENIPLHLEMQLEMNIAGRSEDLKEYAEKHGLEDMEIPQVIKIAAYLTLVPIVLFIIQLVIFNQLNMLIFNTTILLNIAVMLMLVIVCIFILNGKQWPRIVMSIILALNIIFIVSGWNGLIQIFRMLPNMGIFIFILTIIELGSKITVVAMLFSQKANRFYRGGKQITENVLDQL